MKTPDDIKMINLVTNINRGLNYWEIRVDFYDKDTGEILPRVYTVEKELTPAEISDFVEARRQEIIIEVETRQNAPDIKPEIPMGI